MHKNSLYICGNKTEFFCNGSSQPHQNIWSSFPIWTLFFFFFFYLAFHILRLVKVKQVLAKKTSEKGLMVWGSAKGRTSKLFHIDPQVPEISSKREEPPMTQVIQSFSGWLKSSYQRLRVHRDLKWVKWNSLIHSYRNITCSFNSHLGDLKYDNYFQLPPFSEILCT